MFGLKLVETNFKTYLDEKIHSDPSKAVDAKTAGINDAKKTPPEPGAESEGPVSGYIRELYESANTFFDTHLKQCRENMSSRVEGAVKDIKDLKERSSSDYDLPKLDSAIGNCDAAIDFKDYKDRYRAKVGEWNLDRPPKPSKLLFGAKVAFVVVFEFVLVWYFLSEQLGVAGAIYVSLVATTLVVLLAALSAFSSAYTSKDLKRKEIVVGHAGRTLSILLLLFGIGLLSGWRADSTREGLDLVFAGFQAFASIEVYVTAIFNFAGFVFLSWEFKHFFYPLPLFHFGQKKRATDEDEAESTEKSEDLKKALEEARQEWRDVETNVTGLRDELDALQENPEYYIEKVASKLPVLVEAYQTEYAKGNLEYRTEDAFPQPTWLNEYKLEIDLGDKCAEMQKQLKKHLDKIDKQYLGFQEKKEDMFEHIDKIKKEMEVKMKELNDALGNSA